MWIFVRALAEANKQKNSSDKNHTRNPKNFTDFEVKIYTIFIFQDSPNKNIYRRAVMRASVPWYSGTVMCPRSEPKLF